MNNIRLDIEPDEDCPLMVANTYGGGNEAEGGGGVITLGCGTHIGTFYGGSRNADLTGDVVLNVEGGVYENLFGGSRGTKERPANIFGSVTVNVTGGNIQNLFGGSDTNGNITGKITVNVDLDPDYNCPDGLRLDKVYGSGNLALYLPTDPTLASPEINIIHDSVSATKKFGLQTVYGGGYGNGTDLIDGYPSHADTLTGYVKANPVVNIGGIDKHWDKNEGETGALVNDNYRRNIVTISGNVYGGGEAAPVEGSPIVTLYSSRITGLDGEDNPVVATRNHDTTVVQGTVYGGGFGPKAKVTGNTTVGIFGDATVVEGNVYGGGEAAVLTGSTDVQVGYQRAYICMQPTVQVNSSDDKVTLYSATPGATVYYIIDGDFTYDGAGIPTNGTVYNPASKPTLTTGHTIKAIAVKSGYDNSVPGSLRR